MNHQDSCNGVQQNLLSPTTNLIPPHLMPQNAPAQATPSPPPLVSEQWLQQLLQSQGLTPPSPIPNRVLAPPATMSAPSSPARDGSGKPVRLNLSNLKPVIQVRCLLRDSAYV